MNFLLKYVVTNIVASQVVKAVVVGFETALANYSPDRHAEYVDHFAEGLETRTAAFIARNEALIERFNPEQAAENAANVEKVKSIFEEFINHKPNQN